jgi:uncharacterized protein (TIGR02722 family)
VKKLTIILLSFGLLLGCSSKREVSRLDPGAVTDLSGSWNETDARLVAEEMVTDCLAKVWLTDFLAANGKKPVVTMGTIGNKSSEHIDMEVFTNDFERELINSGKVRFVASRGQRPEIRDERMDQQQNASEESMKQFGKEVGADFIILGSVKSITDQIEGRSTTFYQTDFELVNLETNEKVWIGTKEIKKGISQGKTKW